MGTPLYDTDIKTVPNRPELTTLDDGDFYLVFDTSTGKISRISKTNAQSQIAYDNDTTSFIANTLASGAIIERGSNANGEYVKFADGTMMCWKLETVDDQVVATAYGPLYTGFRSYEFPAAFTSIPTPLSSMFVWSTGSGWAGGRQVNRYGMQIVCRDIAPRQAGTDAIIGYAVIGRWK